MPDITELLGFLTVVEYPRLGLVGGLLILNPAGRPVEFHCTIPVRANRTQEILYGSSLYPFLYGEQIARTLVSKAKSVPELLLTDSMPVLAVQDFTDIPVLFVNIPEAVAGADDPDRLAGSLRSFGIVSGSREGEEHTDSAAREAVSPPKRLLHDIPGFAVDRWHDVLCGKRLLSVPARDTEELNTFRERLGALMKTVDFAEPFERIRLAIEETQKAA